MSHRFALAGMAGWCLCACADPAPSGPAVRPGIEVLLTDSLHLVAGRRVGLLTNQTGIGRDGTGDVELLLASDIDLRVLFSPEHGFRGMLDESNIAHGTDSATGLPIYSLYGDIRAPTDAMLADIDVLVIDLQDIGARTYTYISTALLAMQSAARAGRAVLLLDRPNPLGGVMVQGGILDTAAASFVGMLPVPLRHGLTMGELARFGRAVMDIGVDLTVVPADGWRRETWFDDTGLPWVRPSPNMPDLESATHYPGIVLFEATNLSVGRGTPMAFQVVGAPWLSPRAVLERLGEHPGVAVRDTSITPDGPTDGKYAGETIPALRFRVTDRRSYDSGRLALDLLAAVAAVHQDRLVLREAAMDRLAGGTAVRLVGSGRLSVAEVLTDWGADEATFRDRRAAYLLYP